MHRILSASRDTYITNKIMNNSFRATDANVGGAGTLDLFKLYNENTVPGESTPVELSRLLIKFPISEIKQMDSQGDIDINDSSFKCELKLHDVYGGQTTPSNFTMILFPTAKEFVEGNGMNVVTYTDLGITNFVTASIPSTATPQVATATLTVSDGDDNTAENLPAEKSTITIVSTNGTSKKYVIVDDNATTVATGDILTADSDTGASTAGDTLAGGIAVAINLTGGSISTQNAVLVQLKAAIESAHSGKITVSAVPGAADGSQSITLTQVKTGFAGNSLIVNNLEKVTSTHFTGGTGGPLMWHQAGALRSGSLGEANIDVIVSGTLLGSNGSETVSLSPTQYFEKGTEDLNIDVTKIVSGTVSNQINDYGFLLALSGAHEKDEKSYFVKRFAARDVQVAALRPKLVVKYDDSRTDRHSDFIFNVTSSLYLQNYHYGTLSNILSGTSATPLTGGECMIVKIESGSFKKIHSASQALNGRHRMDGVYSASFAISSFEPLLYKQANITGSITFNEIWSNENETVAYLSSSLEITREGRLVSNLQNQNNLLVTVLNLNDEYRVGETVNIRVFAEDRDREVVVKRRPFEKESQIFSQMYYRVRDVQNGKILIDFDKVNNSTKLSTDKSGMFFTFFTDSLPKGRVYSFDFLISRNGKDTVIKDAASKFRIV